ncbi:unnamed protein product [Allacma fusca]|uniref:Uncharacterized protein n=1 Tax=Allacma fusca TaxID=39272 RepID=A0A8J2L0T3_9HEXA|nr:unnamed protein product [Allacma fusca]
MFRGKGIFWKWILKAVASVEEVSEEYESESSGDDIQHVRVKIEPQLPGETKKAGPFFEVVPKVENIDVVVESSEEDNDDEKDEDWSLDAFDKNKSKRPSRYAYKS